MSYPTRPTRASAKTKIRTIPGPAHCLPVRGTIILQVSTGVTAAPPADEEPAGGQRLERVFTAVLATADVDRTVGTQYEVTRDPSEQYAQYARRYAYLIGPDGVIKKSYDVTDVAAHADAVLADIEQLSM